MKLRASFLCLAIAAGVVGAPVAHASTGPKVYVGTGNGEVWAVDTESGDRTMLLQTGLLGDFDVAQCADGRLYVSAGGQVIRVRPDGSEPETVFTNIDAPFDSDLSFLFPRGLACDSSGNLLIAAGQHPTATLWRLDGVTAAAFGGPFQTPTPMTAATDNSGEEVIVLHDGKVAVLNFDGRIDLFSRRFETLAPLTAVGADLPFGFAQNGAGDLLLANVMSVDRYDAGGTFIDTVFSVQDEFPYRVEVALNGTVYVSTDSGLWAVDAAGAAKLVAPIAAARGIAIDRASEAPDVRTVTFRRNARAYQLEYGNATVRLRYDGNLHEPVEAQVERRLVPPASLAAYVRRNFEAVSLPGDGGFITVLKVNRIGNDEDRHGRRGGHTEFHLRWAFNFDGAPGRPRLMVERQRRNSSIFEDQLDAFSMGAALGKDLLVVSDDVEAGSRFFLAKQTRRR